MSGIEELSAEIRRVVESPFVPCLQKLHDALTDVDTLSFKRWARANECLVKSLVPGVIEGLERWPYSLEILRKLCVIAKFRNALLQQKPLLLSSLLQKAADSEAGYDQYGSSCVALLSTPLRNISLPETFPSLLKRTVERAAKCISLPTIRPVYQLLCALGSSKLNCLSLNLRIQLQNEALRTVKQLNFDDYLANLLCIAVLAKIAWSDSPAGDGRVNQQVYLQAARQFFTSAKAQKTLDLVVLEIILVCSKSSPSTLTGDLESLHLAHEIVEAVHIQERESWVVRNLGETCKMNKFYGKIQKQGIDEDVQCAALDFACALVGQRPVPSPIANLVEAHLHTKRMVDARSYNPSRAFGQVQQSAITKALGKALELVIHSRDANVETLTRIDGAREFVKALGDAVDSTPPMRDAALSETPSEDFLKLLKGFVSMVPREGLITKSNSRRFDCPAIFLTALEDLSASLQVLLLKSALHATASQRHIYLPILISLLVIQRQKEMPQDLCIFCEGKRGVTHPAPSIFEAGSIPESRSISYDWKSLIEKQLQVDARLRYKEVLRIVGDVCRDLETRCNEVERPLRDEQTKRHELQGQLEASVARIGTLEEENRVSLSGLGEERAEKQGLSAQLNDLNVVVRQLSERLMVQREAIERSESQSRVASEAAAESSRERDLAYMATLKGKDEVIDEQASELQAARLLSAILRQEIDWLKQQNQDSVESLLMKDKSIENMQTTLVDIKKDLGIKDIELLSLQDTATRLLEEKEETQLKAKAAADSNALTLTDLERRLETAQGDMDILRRAFDTEIKFKDTEHATVTASNQAAICNLHEQVEEGRKRVATISRAKDAEAVKFQKEISVLQRDRDKISRDFTKAQELGRRLFTVVGIDSSRNQTSPVPRSLAAFSIEAAIGSPTNSLASNRSGNSCTSTPKRSRIRPHSAHRSFLVTKELQTPPRMKKRSSSSCRKPLSDSQNALNRPSQTSSQISPRSGLMSRKHSIAGLPETSRRCSDRDLDESSFRSDDLFIGSKYEQPLAQISQPSGCPDDDETIDF